MKLSTKGRYAVMAMADIAANSKGRPISLWEIAERQEISLSYLEQLFGKLRRGQLVKSVRGPGGGYLLSRRADEIPLSDIVLAVAEPVKATRCQPAAPEGCRNNETRCLTHDLWEELGNRVHQFLSSLSLEDVCARRAPGAGGPFDPGGAAEGGGALRVIR